jgi:hypothetical protein
MSYSASPFVQSGINPTIELIPHPQDYINQAAASAAAAQDFATAAASSAVLAAAAAGGANPIAIDLVAMGAVNDGKTAITTVNIALSSRVVNVADPIFSAADVGKVIGMGSTGKPYITPWVNYTTITAYYSPTSIQTSASPSNSFGPTVGAIVDRQMAIVWGTDTHNAWTAAMNAVRTTGRGAVFIPPGRFVVSRRINVPSRCTIFGIGPASEIISAGIPGTQSSNGSGAIFLNDNAIDTSGFHKKGPTYFVDTTPANQIDTEITFSNFKISHHGQVAGGSGKTIDMTLATKIKVHNIDFDYSGVPGVPITIRGCRDVEEISCRTRRATIGHDHWCGGENIKILNNYIEMADNGIQGININAVGTTSLDTGIIEDVVIANNTIIGVGGPVVGGLAFIFLDGLAAGNVTKNVRVLDNFIVNRSGRYTAGVVHRGVGNAITIRGNVLENVGDDSQAVLRPILVGIRQTNTVVPLVNGMSTTAGSDVIGVNYPSHGVTLEAIANGVWLKVAAGSVNGVTFPGGDSSFYPIVSILSPDAIAIKGPSAATSTGTGYSGNVNLYWGTTRDCVIDGNIIINPKGIGHPCIEVGGRDAIVTNNIVRILDDSAPTYSAIVSIFGESAPGAQTVTGNRGPSGTGPGSGWQGNGRVIWRASERPLMLDPRDLVASYASDAAAASGGVPIGGTYRNGSVIQVRVT